MRIVAIVFILFSLISVRASHIIGGDIYYDYLGNNQYRFFITLYRDCNSTGAEYDNPLKLTIYNASGALIQDLSVPFPGSIVLPLQFNNPCATPPSNICVQRAIYTVVVTLPPIPGGYTISYQRCCRGPNISNLINPDDAGLTLTTHVPGSETGFTNNSSPRFTNYPPILLCNNEEKVIDHSATDPDGDSLSYALITPFTGGSSANPAPNQALPPPYFPVQWIAPFNAQLPLGPGSGTSINAQTGILTVNPSLIGLFVVGIVVKEYRNGVFVGQTIRDFVFRVFNCNITLQAILPEQEELSTFISFCQGLTVQFENNSYGGSSYAWDFGVTGTTSDVSSVFAPSYTYPQPGTYVASLIVNPGQPCTDTAYMSITINNPFSISWASQDSLCILNHSFDFVGNMSNPSANFSWDFNQAANVGDISTLLVSDVTFSQPGFHVITLNGDDGDCQTSYTDSIFIFDEPISSFNAPINEQCLGLTIPFENNSQNSVLYLWDFGENNTPSDQSTNFEPIHFYGSPGNYTVQLIASSTPGCTDTSDIQITVLDPLAMSIVHDDSLCITDGLFDFNANVTGPPNYTLEWVFGSEAIPSGATTEDVQDVQYTDFGFQPVMLIGRYDICSDTVFSVVRIFGEPSIDFQYVNSLQCAPSTAVFVNQSFSDGPASYTWNFGDGGSSQSFSPSHLYTEVGSYSVGLTMITTTGCIDTLFLLQQDLVVVYPNPIAGFNVSPQLTDICNAEITFTDQSQDGNQYLYLFDNGFGSTEANFTHTYVNVGTDSPLQIVTNQYGCSDSARNTIMIEPFAIYVPNTFIPDGNEINDIFIPKTDFETNGWQFSVFNKWGERVFYTEDMLTGWNGMYESKPCQDDAYIWTLKYRGCDSPQEWRLLQGFVNLVK
ncbi:MAG: hypothetical protein RL037_41 [Bacteroidota bacterium]|jgi:gliding motility-associated-like protein